MRKFLVLLNMAVLTSCQADLLDFGDIPLDTPFDTNATHTTDTLISERDGTHLQAVGGEAVVWVSLSTNATDTAYRVTDADDTLNSEYLAPGVLLVEFTNGVYVVDRAAPDVAYGYSRSGYFYYIEGEKQWSGRAGRPPSDNTFSLTSATGGATGLVSVAAVTVTNNIKSTLLKESALDEYSKTNHTHAALYNDTTALTLGTNGTAFVEDVTSPGVAYYEVTEEIGSVAQIQVGLRFLKRSETVYSVDTTSDGLARTITFGVFGEDNLHVLEYFTKAPGYNATVYGSGLPGDETITIGSGANMATLTLVPAPKHPPKRELATVYHVADAVEPLASTEWVEQTYFDLQTYTNLTQRAGMELKFGERIKFFTVLQGATNSIHFSGSFMQVEAVTEGFANGFSRLWSDCLHIMDRLRDYSTMYYADEILTVSQEGKRRLRFPGASGTLATEERAQELIDVRVPAPPASGTYVLISVNGAIQWAEAETN